MCDLSGKFTSETEARGGHLEPTPNAVFWWNSMKSRVHFNCREKVGIKFQPVSLWQIRRIKHSTPIFEAPRARAEAYLLLIGQIQNEIASVTNLQALESSSVSEMS